MKKSLFKKVTTILITGAMVLSSTGCSKILEGIAAKELNEVLTETLDAFYDDPINGLSDYDSYEVPEMLEESLGFALDGIAASSYEIGEPEFNKDRTKAEVTVTFSNVLQVGEIPMGTVDEVSDYLGDCDDDDIEITFSMKNSKGDWVVTDVSELIDVFFTPYESLIFVDENGMPTSYYAPFFDDLVVDTVWYEPLMSNPLDVYTINGTPEALTAYVYFNRPVYLEFEANLLKDGDVIQTLTVTVTNGSTACCEFWGQSYSSGSYTVELLFDGSVVTTSEPVTVSER